MLRVRELAAWGFDESPYRPVCVLERAEQRLAARAPFVAMDCVVAVESGVLAVLFAEQAARDDLREEMEGLDWSLGVVDLRGLIAFQRRVVFHPELERVVGSDWGSLFRVAFGAPGPLVYTRRETDEGGVVIETANPNLQVWPVPEGQAGLFEVHGGSPFFEVGEYRGRWFLRDGYHRAYELLRAGIAQVPAVIVRARTLAELGPVGDWFYAEEILFGERPPMVTDFLEDEMTIEYARPRMLKTIRIMVEESFAPVVEGMN
jgi:hypothetical protein